MSELAKAAGVLRRDDFMSDAAYRQYLNGIAAMCEMQFSHAISALDGAQTPPPNTPTRAEQDQERTGTTPFQTSSHKGTTP